MSTIRIIREELNTTFKHVPTFDMFVSKFGPDLILYLKLTPELVYSFNCNSVIKMDGTLPCKIVDPKTVNIQVTL